MAGCVLAALLCAQPHTALADGGGVPQVAADASVAIIVNAPWRAYPNLVPLSRLGFPARYTIAVDETKTGEGSVEPLIGLKRMGGALQTGIEPGGETLVEGTDIGVLGVAAATAESALNGTYMLEGLSPAILIGNTWGGQAGVTDILGSETSIPQSFTIAEFSVPHFVRLCIDRIIDPGNSGNTLPLVAFSVDGEAVTRSAPGNARDVAMWQHGCVDLSGSTFTATLVRKIDPDKPPLPFPGPVRVLGALAFAPLDQVRAATNLANLEPKPRLGGTFQATWRTFYRNAVIAYNLPAAMEYAISYPEFVNDGYQSSTTVNREKGKPAILMHEGGGVVVHASQVSLTKAVPSGIGKFMLVGYGEADFDTVKFALSGDPRFAPAAPQITVARFQEPQLMRVCIDSSKLIIGGHIGLQADPSRRAHATIFADGRPVLPGGLPIPLFKACMDLAAKTVEVGFFADQQLDPGAWRIEGTLYHRPLSAN
ncbi:hypothetical protein C8N35_101354 [Breoghania corrubedonensis]|uniref:Uncharacterized protein n=1 Tax=Breoghania corrubedonensis TaxID=665038 RepID=A0A2T5VEY7_9HYPH|nr:hypothetical protein [Breoghania corrubedonensis]PTW62314.1 hypothetical protein C8N35_101354 [Breoghania corrubedonensis]